ncbi:hypothetical protein EDM80_07200 [bacterium]|nr:MAG: hypothetical protein EDM80_07200 [bacterium]
MDGAGQEWPEVPVAVRQSARESITVLIAKLRLDPAADVGIGALLPRVDNDVYERERAETTARNQVSNAFSLLWAAMQIMGGRGSAADEIREGLARAIRAELTMLSSIAWGRAPRMDEAQQFHSGIVDVLMRVHELLPAALKAARRAGYDEGYAAGVTDIQAWTAAGSALIWDVARAWAHAAGAPIRAPVEVAEHVYDRAKEELQKGASAARDGLEGLLERLREWLTGAGAFAAAGLGVALLLLLGLAALAARRR